MPRLKQDIPWARLQRLIRGYGLNGAQLANVLRVSEPTARKRLQDPGLLTLDDLYAISQRGHIPLDELRGAIQR